MNITKFIDTNCLTPDFPKPGVQFIDIFPLLQKFNFRDCQKLSISEPIIFVPEARGFLFYSFLGADRCIPLRKQGKLPGTLHTIPYEKEYGQDVYQFQEAVLRSFLTNQIPFDYPIPVTIFDDIIATGKSMRAVIDYLNNLTISNSFATYKFKVSNVYSYIYIKSLNAKSLLSDVNIHSVYEY